MKKKIVYILIVLIISIFSLSSLTSQSGNGSGESININFSGSSRVASIYSGDTEFIGKSENLSMIIGYGNAKKVKFSPADDKLAVSTSLGIEIYSYTPGGGGGGSYGSAVTPTLIRRWVFESAVNDFDFKRDGTKIAVGLDNGELYEINTSKSLYRLKGTHSDYISAVAYGEGSTILTAGSDYNIRVWGSYSTLYIYGHTDKITCIDVSADGEIVLSGGKDTTVMLSSIDGGRGDVLYTHDNWVNAVDISPDGKYVISGGSDNLFNLYNLTNDQIEYKGIHTSWVTGVEFTSDSKNIISSGKDGYSYVWKYRSGHNLLDVIGIYKDTLDSLSLSRDNTYAAYTSAYEEAVFLNISDAVKLGGDSSMVNAVSKLDHYTSEIYSMDISNGSKYAVTGHPTGDVRVWDLISGKVSDIAKHMGPVYDVAFNSDLSRVASVGSDGFIRLWKSDSNDTSTLSTDKSRGLFSVAVNDSASVVVGGSYGKIIIWNIDNIDNDVPVDLERKALVNALKFAPGGKYLGIGLSDGTILIRDMELGQLKELGKTGGMVNNIDFTKDGKYLLSSSTDGIVKRWSMDSSISNIVGSADGNVSAFTYDSKENSYLVLSDGNQVIGYNLRTGDKEKYTITNHKGLVTCVGRSYDDMVVYSAGNDGIIKATDLSKRSSYNNNKFFDLTLDVKISRDRKLWDLTTMGDIDYNLVKDSDSIYAMYDNKNLVRIDKAKRELIWTYEMQATMQSSPVVVGDKIYLVYPVNIIDVVDKGSGELLDSFNMKELFGSTTGALADNNGAYVTDNKFFFETQGNSYLFGIDAESNEFILDYKIMGNGANTPNGDGDRLYNPTQEGTIIAFDLESMEVLWKKEKEVDRYLQTKPIIYSNKVICAEDYNSNLSKDRYIVAYHKITGDVKWKTAFKGAKKRAWPVVDDKGYGYFFEDVFGVVKVNLDNGELEQFIPISKSDRQNFVYMEVLDDELLITGHNDDLIRSYDTNTGELKWSYAPESYVGGISIPLIEKNNEDTLIYTVGKSGSEYKIFALYHIVQEMRTQVFRREEMEGGR